jgi:hypothetical protein
MHHCSLQRNSEENPEGSGSIGWQCNRGPRVTLGINAAFEQFNNNEMRKRLQLGLEFQGVGESDQDCCLLRCTVSLQGPPGMRTIKDDATFRLD